MSKSEMSGLYADKIHILSCVEPFSRKCWLFHVKDQKTVEVISAIKHIKNVDYLDLKTIKSDRGSAQI